MVGGKLWFFILRFEAKNDNLSSISLILKKEGFFGSEQDALNTVYTEDGWFSGIAMVHSQLVYQAKLP